MFAKAVSTLNKENRHILICDADSFSKHMLNFLLHTVYGVERTTFHDVRKKIETDLKWTLDYHVSDIDVIREWLEGGHPLICVTELGFAQCTELIKEFPDYEISVYSWMSHAASKDFSV